MTADDLYILLFGVVGFWIGVIMWHVTRWIKEKYFEKPLSCSKQDW